MKQLRKVVAVIVMMASFVTFYIGLWSGVTLLTTKLSDKVSDLIIAIGNAIQGGEE